MKYNLKIYILLCFLFLFFSNWTYAKDNTENIINPKLFEDRWSAYWICYPESPYQDYGVYNFRKTFNIEKIPDKFIIHISADNRYILFCNGKQVCEGPSRDDLNNWRFETVDLSTYLKSGNNILAVVVWNFGILKPIWQFSYRTGLIVQGNSKIEEIINTNESWKCFHNISYKGISVDTNEVPFYCVVGPGDLVNGNDYPWGWETLSFNDSLWKKSLIISSGSARNAIHFRARWMLVPRQIPLLEKKEERMERIALQEGISVSTEFIKGNKPFTIPANKKVKILFDRGNLTTAYPEIIVEGGKNSEIKMKYAEGLWLDREEKGNRNVVEGKQMKGYYDIFITDGGLNRMFKPLYWRTFRYIEIEIKTKDSPLIIKDFKSTFTAYPFQEKASFDSDVTELKKIWEICWRTQRLCANETYFDCPYYEQLQYVGDTRIQALISLYVSGDDRLIRNALELWDHSRISDGLTTSRYPTFAQNQFIPTYSLEWVGMIYDFLWYRDDSEYIKRFLPGIYSVLNWFEQYLNKNYVLGKTQWWNFIDWAPQFNDGVPPQMNNGESSILSLTFAKALREASYIEGHFGHYNNKEKYRLLSDNIISGVYKECWDFNKGMLADTPEKSSFSQHANILAILLDMIPEEKQKELMDKIISDKSLTQCTYYYQFYLHRALKKTGLGDKYLDFIKPWYEMLLMGLTTCPENPEPVRSDCHAWSAHPNFNFLSIICGIDPASPGFKEIEISPNLGPLEWVKGIMPHPNGLIEVEFAKVKPEGLKAVITLPDELTGWFLWKDKKVKLQEGKQIITY
jgi:hypothetical protein